MKLTPLQQNARYARGLGRALIGAVLFALPLYMTSEMWSFGYVMERERLALLLFITFPMLVALSYFAGFEKAFGLVDHLLDASAAFGIAVLAAAGTLWVFGIISHAMTLDVFVGKVALSSFPGSIGAILADKQLGGRDDADSKPLARHGSYGARLFLIAVGAVFLALNVAPTDEMVLIAFHMNAWQAAGLCVLSLVTLHAVLFLAGFPGEQLRRGDNDFWSIFVRYSLAGYGMCLLVSLYILWSFGRTDGVNICETVEFVVVLAFPAALGAATAQLVLGDQRHG